MRAGPESDSERSGSGGLKVRNLGGKESVLGGGGGEKRKMRRKEAQAWRGARYMGYGFRRSGLGKIGDSGEGRTNTGAEGSKTGLGGRKRTKTR